MYQNEPYIYEEKNPGTMMPFMMGMITGVAACMLYIAGRDRRFGPAVADTIENLEHKAGELKHTVVEKAGELKDVAVQKMRKDQPEHTLDAASNAMDNVSGTVRREAERVGRAATE
jgi:hypothetical protein